MPASVTLAVLTIPAPRPAAMASLMMLDGRPEADASGFPPSAPTSRAPAFTPNAWTVPPPFEVAASASFRWPR